MEGRKYIIVELIPTALDPTKGEVVQISALKLDGLILQDRFDYRLKEEKINNLDIVHMISYDKENFTYVDTSRKMMMKFKKWIEDYDLLIIDNLYTRNYLKNISNPKESIFTYLNLEFSDDVIDLMMKKYQLEPSNHIVDLLYEALIFESDLKKGD